LPNPGVFDQVIKDETQSKNYKLIWRPEIEEIRSISGIDFRIQSNTEMRSADQYEQGMAKKTMARRRFVTMVARKGKTR
jgi:hypothetical protein